MPRRLALVVLPAVTLAVSLGFARTGSAVSLDASIQLQALFDAEWEARLRDEPLFASEEVGDYRWNDRLPSVSVADEERRARARGGFLGRLHAIDRAALAPAEQASYDIFERILSDENAEFMFRSFLMPITNRSGFHVSFAEMPKRVPLATVKDYEDYIARLQGFAAYAAQNVELMRQGIRERVVLPQITLVGYEGAIEPHIVDVPSQSRLYAPFENFPDAISEADRARLRDAGVDAIAHSVVPGYREFLRFMREEYVPAAREAIAASSLPNGRAWYEHRVRHYTTLNRTPYEMHQTGLAEVARIRAEMDSIIARVGFEGSFAEFVEFLRSDPRFYVGTPEQLMKEVALVLKRMDGELPRLFKTLPRTPYGIAAVPDYIAPKTTTAYYDAPAGDGTRAGTYFVNTYDLKSRPLYEIEALSLHEAVPGHHLQIALQQELTGLPAFRRFNGFTAFVEGWALYAERLGLEAGGYSDPYSDFGRLTYEMWRACRLVVDPGIHSLGWTRAQAIDFMAENSALSLHNIETEVDRYIAWPGQALAYKTGELKIRELRARAEAALGERFNLRAFHDAVLLSGAVPLDLLEKNVDAFVARERAGGGAAAARAPRAR